MLRRTPSERKAIARQDLDLSIQATSSENKCKLRKEPNKSFLVSVQTPSCLLEKGDKTKTKKTSCQSKTKTKAGTTVRREKTRSHSDLDLCNRLSPYVLRLFGRHGPSPHKEDTKGRFEAYRKLSKKGCRLLAKIGVCQFHHRSTEEILSKESSQPRHRFSLLHTGRFTIPSIDAQKRMETKKERIFI